MKKHSLTVLMDAALVIALARMIGNLSYPWEQTLEAYWEMERIGYLRYGASILWLAALWIGMYGPWDSAERVSQPVVLLGAARAIGTLLAAWAAELVYVHYKACLSQTIYGVVALAAAAVDLLLLRCLEKANPEAPGCAEASRRWRVALLCAIGILAVGLMLTVIRFRRAMWISVALAGAFLLAYRLFTPPRSPA